MALIPGQVVDHYRLDDIVHRGLRTTVFAATDQRDGARIAVTVLNDAYAADAQARQRLVDRAERARQLGAHPNILRVHSRGQVGESLYLVSELVAGVSLRRLLDRQPDRAPLPVQSVVAVLGDVAAALDHAADCGVDGRSAVDDVLVIRRGTTTTALLTDLGGDHAGGDVTGATVAGRAHRRGLTAVAYELLTDQAPPSTSSGIASPRAVRPELPERVDAVFAGAGGRIYRTCRSFVDALAEALSSAATTPQLTQPAAAVSGVAASRISPPTADRPAPTATATVVAVRSGGTLVRWVALLAGLAALLVGVAFGVVANDDDQVAATTATTLFAPAATASTSTTVTATTSTTSTTTSTTSTTLAPTTTAAPTTQPPVTMAAPPTTLLGPNGRAVGAVLSNPQGVDERLVLSLAGRTDGDDIVSPGSPADVYQRWARSIPGGGDVTITAAGYAVVIDRVVELRDFVLDDDGRVADLTECVDDGCRSISSVVIWPEMCGSYTCGTVFSSSARFPVRLVATLYARPDTPIQMFELDADEPVATVDDAGGVVWFDPTDQRLVITLPHHPAPGTQTVIAMTMSSGGRDFTSVVYDD